MKYYNFETDSTTLSNKLIDLLKENNTDFEISAAGPMIHFEILTDAAGADAINNFIAGGAIVCI